MVILGGFQLDELLGDKILSSVLVRLFKKWRLLTAWSLTLHEMISSNANWARLASCWKLPDANSALKELGVDISDAFEVIPLFM